MKLKLFIILVTIMTVASLIGTTDYSNWYNTNFKVFSTKNHPKSKGLNMSFKYPDNWISEEGERPNVVQKFTNDDDGYAMCLILTKSLPVPDDYTITDEEIDQFFTLEEAGAMIPPGSELISFNKTRIEALPAGILEYRTQGERAGTAIELYIVSYVFIFRNVMVFFQCSVGDIPDHRFRIKQQFELLRPVFKQMANSIILPDRWLE